MVSNLILHFLMQNVGRKIKQLLGKESTHLLILLLVSIFTTSLAINYGLLDAGFVYGNLAASVLVDQNGKITAFSLSSNVEHHYIIVDVRLPRLIPVLLAVFLHKMTGLPYSELYYYPLTGIILPLIAYIVAKRLLSSSVHALIYGLVVAFEPQALGRNYNMNIQGFGFLFFFIIILLYQGILNNRSRKLLCLLFLFVLTIPFTYYSTEFFAFLFFTIILLLSLMDKVFKQSFSKFGHYAMNLALLSAISMMLFETLITNLVGFYGENVIPSTNPYQTIAQSIRDFTSTFSFTGPSRSMDTTFTRISNLLYPILVIIPILYFLFFYCGKKPEKNLTFCYALLLIAITESLTYLLISGELYRRSFYFILPLGSLLAIEGITKNRLAKYWKVALLAVILLRFTIYMSEEYGYYALDRDYFNVNLYDYANIIKFAGGNQSRIEFLSDTIAIGRIAFASAMAGEFDEVFVCSYKSFTSSKFLYESNERTLREFLETYGSEINHIITWPDVNRRFPGSKVSEIFPPIRDNLNNLLEIPTVNLIYSGSEVIWIKYSS